MRRIQLSVCLVSVVACAEPGVPEPELGTIFGPGCPPGECAANAPKFGGIWFHELSKVFGTPNAEGFYIFGTSGNLSLDVVNGRLLASDVNGQWSGQGLVGWNIYVASTASSHVWSIRVQAVDSRIPYWAIPPGPVQSPTPPNQLVEAYKLLYTEFDRNGRVVVAEKNVCDRALDSTDRAIYETMNGEYAVLFEGDRLDEVTKTVGSTLDNNWFNIGCAGNLLAKLHLNGHTKASMVAGFSTTIPQRQTMVKMLGADYCGDGTPFTVFGQKVVWHDDQGRIPYNLPPVSIEARWTPTGAACLSTPRVEANDSADPDAQLISEQEFGAMIMDDVANHCALPPRCDASHGFSSDPDVQAGYHLVSANP